MVGMLLHTWVGSGLCPQQNERGNRDRPTLRPGSRGLTACFGELFPCSHASRPAFSPLATRTSRRLTWSTHTTHAGRAGQRQTTEDRAGTEREGGRGDKKTGGGQENTGHTTGETHPRGDQGHTPLPWLCQSRAAEPPPPQSLDGEPPGLQPTPSMGGAPSTGAVFSPPTGVTIGSATRLFSCEDNPVAQVPKGRLLEEPIELLVELEQLVRPPTHNWILPPKSTRRVPAPSPSLHLLIEVKWPPRCPRRAPLLRVHAHAGQVLPPPLQQSRDSRELVHCCRNGTKLHATNLRPHLDDRGNFGHTVSHANLVLVDNAIELVDAILDLLPQTLVQAIKLLTGLIDVRLVDLVPPLTQVDPPKLLHVMKQLLHRPEGQGNRIWPLLQASLRNETKILLGDALQVEVEHNLLCRPPPSIASPVRANGYKRRSAT